ncbi:hypothetical protein Tco_0776994, partial [Tanacetum coccineum]
EPRWLRFEEVDGSGGGWRRTVASESILLLLSQVRSADRRFGQVLLRFKDSVLIPNMLQDSPLIEEIVTCLNSKLFMHFNHILDVCLVSATLPNEILEMTSKFMTDPVRILVKRDELTLEVYQVIKECERLTMNRRLEDGSIVGKTDTYVLMNLTRKLSVHICSLKSAPMFSE